MPQPGQPPSPNVPRDKISRSGNLLTLIYIYIYREREREGAEAEGDNMLDKIISDTDAFSLTRLCLEGFLLNFIKSG